MMRPFVLLCHDNETLAAMYVIGLGKCGVDAVALSPDALPTEYLSLWHKTHAVLWCSKSAESYFRLVGRLNPGCLLLTTCAVVLSDRAVYVSALDLESVAQQVLARMPKPFVVKAALKNRLGSIKELTNTFAAEGGSCADLLRVLRTVHDAVEDCVVVGALAQTIHSKARCLSEIKIMASERALLRGVECLERNELCKTSSRQISADLETIRFGVSDELVVVSVDSMFEGRVRDRAVRVDVEGTPYWVAAPEDVALIEVLCSKYRGLAALEELCEEPSFDRAYFRYALGMCNRIDSDLLTEIEEVFHATQQSGGSEV